MGSAFEYRYLAVFDQTNRPVALQPLVLTTQDWPFPLAKPRAIRRQIAHTLAAFLAKPHGPRRLSRG